MAGDAAFRSSRKTYFSRQIFWKNLSNFAGLLNAEMAQYLRDTCPVSHGGAKEMVYSERNDICE